MNAKIIGDKVCPLLLIARNICITIGTTAGIEQRPPATCLKTDCGVWDTRNHQCGMKPELNPLKNGAIPPIKIQLPQ